MIEIRLVSVKILMNARLTHVKSMKFVPILMAVLFAAAQKVNLKKYNYKITQDLDFIYLKI